MEYVYFGKSVLFFTDTVLQKFGSFFKEDICIRMIFEGSCHIEY